MDEPSSRRKRLRRILVLLAVLALLPVALFLALRSSGFRQSVLRQIAGWLRTEYGLVLKAKDFEARWDGFALDGVEVGAPDARPVFRASRVDVSMDMRTLRGPVRVIRNLEIEDAVLDLSAPIPKLPESDPQAPPGFSITRMVFRRGSVLGPPPEPPLSDWVRSWRVGEVEGGGSYVDGRWDVSIESSRAHVERPGFPALDLSLGTQVEYKDGEPLDIRWVRATGDGLRLTGSASVAMLEGASSYAAFDVQVEPRLLSAGAPSGGSVRAKGELWLPDPPMGKVAVAASGVPAEVLRPYVDAALFQDLSLAGTVADAEADLQLEPAVQGKGKIAWRRGDRQLVRMDLEVKEDQEIRLTAEGDLLPGSPGRRHVRGTVVASAWPELAKGTAEKVDVEVRVPDVRSALAEARALWPRLIPAVPEGVPVQGSLEADARLSGALTSPSAKVDALWVPEPGARVKVRAEGRVATWTGSARAEMENLALTGRPHPPAPSPGPPSTPAPGEGETYGRVSGFISLSGSPRSYRTTVDAEVTQAAYGPYLEGLERGRIRGEGSLALQPLTYTGTLDLDGTGLFARPNASATAQLASFQVESNGTLKLEPMSYVGHLTFSGAGLDAPGMVLAEQLNVDSDGTFRLDPLSYNGKVTLTGTNLKAPETASADQLTLDADGSFCWSKSPPLLGRACSGDRERGPGGEGSVHLTAAGVEIPAAGATLLELQAEASTDGEEVRIASLTGSLPEGRTFSASGSFAADLQTADLGLRLVRPVDPVREAELTATLRKGIVELSAPRIDTDAGPASLRATIPLGALAQIPELAKLPVQPAPGQVSIHAQAPEVDSESLLKALGMEARPERLRGGVTADLTFDPMAPAAGHGEILVEGLTLETKDGRVAAEAPVIARLERGRLELQPVRLRVESEEIGATAIDVKGTADLDPAWKPTQELASLVRSLSAEAGGTLDAALLNPFLEGGIASGALTFQASASGKTDRMEATLAASGPEASFWWPAAAARIEGPSLIGSWSGETWKASGNAGLNGGTLAFSAAPVEKGALVSLNLADIPYRLDYGLTTRLDGVLSLHVPLPLTDEGRLRLDGTLDVERGVLIRDINLDREVLTLLFAPEDTPGAEETLADRIDLDLNVTTEDGVRVRNNVADLRAHWSSLHITGTAENPAIRGRVEIDPGGRADLYGQTVRIDRGALIFTGNPAQDPLVDMATTSSLEDPTIARLAGRPLDVIAQPEAEVQLEEGQDPNQEETATSDVLTSGLAGYYGARVVSRLGESIGLSRLSVRQALVFDKTDPSARLTVGSDLSPNASFALSVDLRNPESRIWLLDLHGFRGLPGLTFEAFTAEAGVEGLSIQQTLDLGGSREVQEKNDRLRRLRLDVPPGISRWNQRALRRAVGLRRKDTVPREAPFEIEVDLAEHLRRLGYPGALVTAEAVPVEDRPGWVDLNVKVAALGPRVEIAFAGDKPPRAFRSEILAAYRADFYEERSLEEMKEAAIRAFRSAGHLDPQVEIEVRPGTKEGRTVVIRSEAGPKEGLEELEIAGVDPGVGRLAAGSFPGRLSRAELAAAVPGADRRLLAALRSLGHPQAAVTGREIAGERLTVRVEPGPRQAFGQIEIAGVEEEERERLAALVPARSGDGFRADLVSTGVLRLEDSLRSRGYPDAAVRAVTYAEEPLVPLVVGVRYEIVPGPQVHVAGVEIEGERWTRPTQLASLTGLEPGEPLDRNAVTEAQSRLYRTGVFSRVTAEVDRTQEDGARVTFSVAESPRFHLGYGVRWESGAGTAAIVDASDTNFLRRGLTLGFRALYEPDDHSGRVYLRTGGLFGTGISLEIFGAARRELIPDEFLGDLERETDESSLQFARPFGRRTTGRLYFRYRSVHLFEVEPDPFFPFDLELNRPYMGTQVLHDTRDDRLDPTAGTFRSLDLSGSGPFLGSDFNYARLYGQVQGYRTFRLAGRRVVWAQAMQSGVAQAYSGQSLISDDRFFAGGEFSVRGYERRSLRVEEGDPSEETLLVLNQELRFPLPFADLTGLVFFDAGQIWEGLGAFGTDLAKSLGLGARYRSPVGLLRLDLAFPLDRRPGDESYQLYLGLGNAF
ncbi:MAG TPA: translocation/assembly module TamB domain-containing protein [Thermoanaerobaculia bacterium]|nr:translocation/assembly module TamB domain-containing protein [Thermoanaerobaculia bacterium]